MTTPRDPHVFVVDVEDEPGVLTRVSSLFRRRGFNIVSLTVGATERPGISRMTIVVDAPDVAARRIEAHLWKLVNVIRVEDVTGGASVRRELVMVKVSADAEARTHVMKLAEVFRARVIDVAPESLILETTGTSDKIAGLLDVLRPFGVLEVARSGHVAMVRGAQAGQARAAVDDTDAVPDNVSYSV
ncbi:MAG TPA: acetolactate synthase small subunit [Vicinamibacterales bacterium]